MYKFSVTGFILKNYDKIILLLILLDINECESLNGGCEHICENIPGTYRCSCYKGWRRNLSKLGSCEDINECLLNNGMFLYLFWVVFFCTFAFVGHGVCAHRCINTQGGFKCSCEGLDGTRLAPDGRRCVLDTSNDADSPNCAELAGCSHTCVLVRAGTAVFCTCPDGLQLGNDWKTCQGKESTYFFILGKITIRLIPSGCILKHCSLFKSAICRPWFSPM